MALPIPKKDVSKKNKTLPGVNGCINLREVKGKAFPPLAKQSISGFLDVRGNWLAKWTRFYFVVHFNFLLTAHTPYADKIEKITPLESCTVCTPQMIQNHLIGMIESDRKRWDKVKRDHDRFKRRRMEDKRMFLSAERARKEIRNGNGNGNSATTNGPSSPAVNVQENENGSPSAKKGLKRRDSGQIKSSVSSKKDSEIRARQRERERRERVKESLMTMSPNELKKYLREELALVFGIKIGHDSLKYGRAPPPEPQPSRHQKQLRRHSRKDLPSSHRSTKGGTGSTRNRKPSSHVIFFRCSDESTMRDWMKQVHRATRLTIRDLFSLKRPLGISSSQLTKVISAVDKKTKAKRAIKIVHKMTTNQRLLRNEVSILKKMAKHRFIVTLHDLFETQKYLYIVMQLCHGTLFDRICEMDDFNYSIMDCFLAMQNVSEAVSFMHKNGVIHRDLKPSNVLCQSHTDITRIKICDFGISKVCKYPNESNLRTIIGTSAYLAPEVLSGRPYNKSCDYWSVGIMIYLILTGHLPFGINSNEFKLRKKIIHEEIPFSDDEWKLVDHDITNLVKGMLNKIPEERKTVEDVLRVGWKVSMTRECQSIIHKRFKRSHVELLVRNGKRKCVSLIGRDEWEGKKRRNGKIGNGASPANTSGGGPRGGPTNNGLDDEKSEEKCDGGEECTRERRRQHRLMKNSKKICTNETGLVMGKYSARLNDDEKRDENEIHHSRGDGKRESLDRRTPTHEMK